jgi:hypothetical protein
MNEPSAQDDLVEEALREIFRCLDVVPPASEVRINRLPIPSRYFLKGSISSRLITRSHF